MGRRKGDRQNKSVEREKKKEKKKEEKKKKRKDFFFQAEDGIRDISV